MKLSELLGRQVVTTTGEALGTVCEALLIQDGPLLPGTASAAFRLHGLAVGRHMLGVRLGYQQGTVEGPWLLKRMFGRSPQIVPWDAIVALDTDGAIIVDGGRLEGLRPEGPLS
jgi:hypothetical protein